MVTGWHWLRNTSSRCHLLVSGGIRYLAVSGGIRYLAVSGIRYLGIWRLVC
jgi:hypothetical protein